MIRPEAKAQIIRCREVLIGALAVLVGLWWLADSGVLLVLPAVFLLVAGAGLIWVGVQRARFRSTGSGPGSVQMDEGQIVYFGPLTGGAMALHEVTRISLDPTLHQAHWRLTARNAPELLIPVNAEGADRLFDAFSSLPGLRMEQVLTALKTHDTQPIVIWTRGLSGPTRIVRR